MEQSRLYEVAKELLTKYGDPPKAKPHFVRKLLGDRKLLDAFALECLRIMQNLGAGHPNCETPDDVAQSEDGGGQVARETHLAHAAAAEARAGQSGIETQPTDARPAPDKPIPVKGYKVLPHRRQRQRTEAEKAAAIQAKMSMASPFVRLGIPEKILLREVREFGRQFARDASSFLTRGIQEATKALFMVKIANFQVVADDSKPVTQAMRMDDLNRLSQEAEMEAPKLIAELMDYSARRLVEPQSSQLPAA